MSLFKRPGSPHYWCRFTLGGRRIQQSTGTKDRKAAEEYEHRLQGRIWRETRLGERTGKRAGLAGLRFHDLRHTWATWLMQAGVPAYAIQSLGGWASPKMVERYAHLSPEHLKQYAAYSKLKA
jgi:integrase